MSALKALSFSARSKPTRSRWPRISVVMFPMMDAQHKRLWTSDLVAARLPPEGEPSCASVQTELGLGHPGADRYAWRLVPIPGTVRAPLRPEEAEISGMAKPPRVLNVRAPGGKVRAVPCVA